MQASEADVRFVFGRISRFRRVNCPRDYYLIGFLAHAAVTGVDLTVA